MALEQANKRAQEVIHQLDQVSEQAIQTANQAAQQLAKQLEDARKKAGEVQANLINVAHDAAQELAHASQEARKEIRDAIDAAAQGASNKMQAASQQINNAAQQLGQAVNNAQQQLVVAGQDAIGQAGKNLADANAELKRLANLSKDAAQAGAEQLSAMVKDAAEQIVQAGKATGRNAQQLARDAKDAIAHGADALAQAAHDAIGQEAKMLADVTDRSAQQLKSAAQSIASSVSEDAKDLAQLARDAAQRLANEGKAALDRIAQQMRAQAAETQKRRGELAALNAEKFKAYQDAIKTLASLSEQHRGRLEDQKVIDEFGRTLGEADKSGTANLSVMSKMWQEGMITKDNLDKARQEMIDTLQKYFDILERAQVPAPAPVGGPALDEKHKQEGKKEESAKGKTLSLRLFDLKDELEGLKTEDDIVSFDTKPAIELLQQIQTTFPNLEPKVKGQLRFALDTLKNLGVKESKNLPQLASFPLPKRVERLISILIDLTAKVPTGVR